MVVEYARTIVFLGLTNVVGADNVDNSFVEATAVDNFRQANIFDGNDRTKPKIIAKSCGRERTDYCCDICFGIDDERPFLVFVSVYANTEVFQCNEVLRTSVRCARSTSKSRVVCIDLRAATTVLCGLGIPSVHLTNNFQN
jgi:hypothetical protein